MVREGLPSQRRLLRLAAFLTESDCSRAALPPAILATNRAAQFNRGIALEGMCRNRLMAQVREVDEVRNADGCARSTHHRPSKVRVKGSAAKVHEPRKLL